MDKHLTLISMCAPAISYEQQPHELGGVGIIIPVLQVRKLK